MSLESELRELLDRTDQAPWPGEPTAYDRFLRRRARHGWAVAAATGLAMVAILAAAVLVPRLLASGEPAAAPVTTTVRVESQGWELPVPAGWKLERKLLGTRVYAPGEVPPGTPVGTPRPAVVGLVLAPRSDRPRGATITIRTADELTRDEGYDSGAVQGSRRADGREYGFHPGSGPGDVGRFTVFWPDYCHPLVGCSGASRPRVVAVAGAASSGAEEVRQVMESIVRALRPITNSVPPPPRPPAPTVPDRTKVRLAEGGSGRTAWELWIEPLDGSPGVAARFPWVQRRTPDGARHWEALEAGMIQQRGTYTLVDCLTWVPGSGLLLSGLARKDVASVRFELAGASPVTVPTIGPVGRIPWVAYGSPVLPAGSRLVRVLGLDATGRTVGGEEDPYRGQSLCRPR
jgi:hypothetical protein